MMREIFAAESRGLYQFGGFYELSVIDQETWTVGIRNRFEGQRFQIDAPALRAIVSNGEGHPRATMLIAQQTHLASIEQGRTDIDASLVDVGLQYAMAQELPTHEADVSHLRSLGRYSVSVAQRIAKRESPYGSDLASAQVARAITTLQKMGIVEREGTRKWRIIDPLFARYLAVFGRA
jgi:hypothetical protein